MFACARARGGVLSLCECKQPGSASHVTTPSKIWGFGSRLKVLHWRPCSQINDLLPPFFGGPSPPPPIAVPSAAKFLLSDDVSHFIYR